MNENQQIAAQQIEEICEMLPRGSKAIQLLITGRNLCSRFMERPGVGSDELRKFIREVDFILGPLERTDSAANPDGEPK